MIPAPSIYWVRRDLRVSDNQALSAAQDAQACCDATNQRIDRLIEEGVAK